MSTGSAHLYHTTHLSSAWEVLRFLCAAYGHGELGGTSRHYSSSRVTTFPWNSQFHLVLDNSGLFQITPEFQHMR